MKVDVLQVREVTFGKFGWWSNWVDIAVYDYDYRPWLIQMSISRTNKKKFRSVCITGIVYKQSTISTVGDLTKMKSEVKYELL